MVLWIVLPIPAALTSQRWPSLVEVGAFVEQLSPRLHSDRAHLCPPMLSIPAAPITSAVPCNLPRIQPFASRIASCGTASLVPRSLSVAEPVSTLKISLHASVQRYPDPRSTSFAPSASYIHGRHSPPSFNRHQMVGHFFPLFFLQLLFRRSCRGVTGLLHFFRRLEPERQFPNDRDGWTWFSTHPSTTPHSPLRRQAISHTN